MAGEIQLPILPPEYQSFSPRASSGGSGTPLFSMSASVGVDAAAFNTGIASITTAINTLNTNITSMLTAIESIASASQTALNLLSAQATTAAQAVEDAADGLSDSEVEDVVETLEDLKEEYGEAAETAETAESTMTSAATGAATSAGTMAEAVKSAETTTASAATGAASAAGEMAKAVDEVGKSAQKSSFSFADMAYAAYKVFGVVKDIAGALWNFGTEMVDAAVSYEMSMRTYATAFSGIEEEAAAAMAELSDETGLYAGVIRGNFAAMQTQFRSAGYEQSDALELSQRAMSLAADAAAHYGITLDEATRKVMSFLRGNQEGGESIGMFISQDTREEYANSLYGKAWKELSEAERQAALLQIAEATYATGGQQGAAALYSDSFIVAQQNLQQRWADIMGKLGTPLMEVVGEVLSSFFDVLDTPEMEQVVDDFSEVLRVLLQNITDVLLEFIKWAASPEGQAAIDKVWGVIDSILGWFGFGDVSEYSNEVSALSGGTVAPEDVTMYSNVLDTVYDLINAADRFYDTDYSDATDAEVTEAWNAYNAAMQDFLSSATAQQQEAMDAWLENSGIRSEDSPWRSNTEGFWPEGTMESLPSFVMNTLNDITSAINDIPGAIVAGMSGVTVQANGVTLGHLVAPTVASDMARNAKFNQYTTAGTTA